MKQSANKRFLILLTALVLICGGMLVLNGTFASRVEYTNDKIELQGSHFAVDLQYWNGTGYESLFTGAGQPFSEASKWCPGRSEIVYLKLNNSEQFPVDCTLSLKVEKSGFDDVISYAVLPANLVNSADHPTSWNDFVTRSSGAGILNSATHQLLEVKPLQTGEEQYLALCLHMDESASSQYQNKQLKMKFSLRVNADYEPGATPGT